MPDVTAAYRGSMGWMVTDLLTKKLMDEFLSGIDLPCGATQCTGRDCPKLMMCASTVNLSPEMKAAIAQLHDLDTGHVTCIRDTMTNDY